jgi:hypothetical protein
VASTVFGAIKPFIAPTNGDIDLIIPYPILITGKNFCIIPNNRKPPLRPPNPPNNEPSIGNNADTCASGLRFRKEFGDFEKLVALDDFDLLDDLGELDDFGNLETLDPLEREPACLRAFPFSFLE